MSLLIKGFKEKAFAASSCLDGNFWKIHLNSKGEKVNATREGWAKLITFFKPSFRTQITERQITFPHFPLTCCAFSIVPRLTWPEQLIFYWILFTQINILSFKQKC